MMHICIVSDPYYPYPSGVTEHVHHLAHHLGRRGHEVRILTAHYGRGEGDYPGVTRVGRILYVPSNKSVATLPFALNLPWQIKKFLGSHHFDILHLHGPFPPNLSFWALLFSRSANVATFHSTRFSFRAPGASVFRVAFRKWYQRLDGLIAVSNAARDSIHPYIPGEYRIIPNAVDTERFNPNTPPLARLGGPNPKILFLGRLDPRKGLEQLLNALPLIRKELPATHLIVAGSGPQESRYKRMASELGLGDSVTFLGFVSPEELPACYASCDVYCSPALGGESFGIVLIEAMASGKAVVASDIPGYREVIKDGENGLLVNPAKPQEIATATIRILRDSSLRKGLERRGRAAAEEYSWSKIAKRIEEFYLEIIGRERNQGKPDFT